MMVTSVPAGAYEPDGTPEDVTADHVEHHVGPTGVLKAVGLQVQKLVDAESDLSLPTRMPSVSSFAASRPGRARRSLIRRQRDHNDAVAW